MRILHRNYEHAATVDASDPVQTTSARQALVAAAAVLYVMTWSVVLPAEHNPVLDDHILGAIALVALVALAALNTGTTWGFEKPWAKTPLVKDNPVLR